MWSGRLPSNLVREGEVPYIYLPTTEAANAGPQTTRDFFSRILNTGRAASNSDILSRIRCPKQCIFGESLTTGQWKLLLILAVALVIITVIIFSTLSVIEEEDDVLTDKRIERLTEELIFLDLHNNNLFGKLNITPDGKKLFQGSLDVLSHPTIAPLIDLQYEYHPDVDVPEVFNDEYYNKQQKFLNAIINTQVMKRTEKVILDTGLVTKPILDTLEDVWFGSYSKSSKGVNGSSGFEHVFAGEFTTRVLGFHNWVYFKHEQDNPEHHPNLTYIGNKGKFELGDSGAILNVNFMWFNMSKTSTMFIGTSPELEMAVYTICFLAKPNQECPVSMGGKKFSIYTHARDNTRMIKTAYPSWELLKVPKHYGD